MIKLRENLAQMKYCIPLSETLISYIIVEYQSEH
jgi:hypothetical protein